MRFPTIIALLCVLTICVFPVIQTTEESPSYGRVVYVKEDGENDSGNSRSDNEEASVFGKVIMSEDERTNPESGAFEELREILKKDSSGERSLEEGFSDSTKEQQVPGNYMKLNGPNDDFKDELLTFYNEVDASKKDVYVDFKMTGPYPNREENAIGVRRLKVRSVAPFFTKENNVIGNKDGNQYSTVNAQSQEIGGLNNSEDPKPKEFYSKFKMENMPGFYVPNIGQQGIVNPQIVQKIREVLPVDRLDLGFGIPGRPVRRIVGIILDRLAGNRKPILPHITEEIAGHLQEKIFGNSDRGSTKNGETTNAGSERLTFRKAVKLGPLSVELGVGK